MQLSRYLNIVMTKGEQTSIKILLSCILLSTCWRVHRLLQENKVNVNILQELLVVEWLAGRAERRRWSAVAAAEILLKRNARCRERRPARCHGHRSGIKSLCMFIAFAKAGGGALECD